MTSNVNNSKRPNNMSTINTTLAQGCANAYEPVGPKWPNAKPTLPNVLATPVRDSIIGMPVKVTNNVDVNKIKMYKMKKIRVTITFLFGTASPLYLTTFTIPG